MLTPSRAVGLVMPGACFSAIMAVQKGWGPFCTLSFDCDFPRDVEVLPTIIDLLEQRGLKGSFACVGRWIRAFPDPHRQLVDAGMEVVNHTETHPNLYNAGYGYARGDSLSKKRFRDIPSEERRDEIRDCHATCVEVIGWEPVGFRTPHFGALHVEGVYDVLRELGYCFSSSVPAGRTPSSGLPYRHDSGIVELPLSPCPRHPFGVLDSWHSVGKHGAAHHGPGELTGLFRELVELTLAQGGYANVYFDPRAMLDSRELVGVLDCLQGSGLETIDYADLASRSTC